MLAKEGRIHEGVGRTRVDQSLDGNRRLAGNEYVDQQGKVARGGEGKGGRRREAPPSQVPTGWDVRFLAGRRWCEGTE